MMKILKKLVCILVFATVAWAENPHEHRGFYFGTGLGVSYLSSALNVNDFYFSSGGGQRNLDGIYKENRHYSEHHRKERFSGFGFPSLDFRFGASFANLLTFYFNFRGGLYSGEGKIYKEDYNVDRVYLDEILNQEDRGLVGKFDRKDDAYAFYGAFGLGFTVYPFRNPASPMYGFYVGVAGGADASVARVNALANNISGSMGIFTRYEIGKEWWVSDTWAIGVGFDFTVEVYGNNNDGDDGDCHTINLFLRLTHG